MVQEPGRAVDLEGANRHGQQLFFANLRFVRHRPARLKPQPRHELRRAFRPLPWRQLVLFDLQADPVVIRRRADAVESELLNHCEEVVDSHAAAHGWSQRQRNNVRRSIRLLQALQDTPGAKIAASDVLQLPNYGGNVESTLDVLETAGLLVDDRTSLAERYFAAKMAGLPESMTAQLEVWLDVMLNGSMKAPRRKARHPQTARLQILAIAPIVRSWVDAGHQSLAEISTDDVLAALPDRGPKRTSAEWGLRSLFSILKAKHFVFADPTRGMPRTPVNATIPLPLDTEAIRQALTSSKPAVALSVALIAFHALTPKQLALLQLTDIGDGQLTLGGRRVPLAGPVRSRLTAWLDHRGRTWPETANPHLFLTRRSAPRLVPVSRAFFLRTSPVSPQALREDRILQEIHASGGDVRRICDLFGMSVTSAQRYAATMASS
jgi:hypothetical protein